MPTATLHQIGETLLIEVPRELAKARHVRPGDTVNFELWPSQAQAPHEEELASQLAIGERIMQRDRNILHALAQ